MLSKSCLRRCTTLYDLLTYSEHDIFQRDSTKIQIIASIVTWHGHVPVSSQGIQDRLGAKSANWLPASWLANWLAVLSTSFPISWSQSCWVIYGENCIGGCTPTFSISQINGVGREVDGWHTYVLTPVNEDVYAKQYENKDAEAQTT